MTHALTIYIFEADCDLSGHMVFRSGSLKFRNDIVISMLGRVIAISTAIAGLLLLIMLQTTNPSTVGPLGLLAVFFLLYIIVLGAMTELLWVGSYIFQMVGRRLAAKRPPGRLSLARAYYFSTVLAFGPIIALAMQSIGSLRLYEMALIGIFLAVGTLYVAKRSSR